MTSTIRCKHCGETEAAKRPDRKLYCVRCATARRILALGLTTKTCRACDEAFYPLDQAHARAPQCHTCTGTPAGESRDGEVCAYCDGRDRLLPGLRICAPCASAPTDKHHAWIMRSLAKKLKEVAA